MNKTELVAAVAEKTGMTKAAAAEAVNALLDTVTNTLAAGKDIAMPGFGTFTVREHTEAGKQAAILHAKAMLGIA